MSRSVKFVGLFVLCVVYAVAGTMIFALDLTSVPDEGFRTASTLIIGG